MFVTCSQLAAWGLKALLVTLVQPIKKFLAALHIGRWKRPMIICEPGQQVIVFNSFHIILSLCPVEVLNSATGPEG